MEEVLAGSDRLSASVARSARTVTLDLLAMGRYGPGVTYTVPRRATINAPPPMGPLGGLTGDPGASFSTYPKGGTIPKGGFLISALSYGGGMGQV